MIAYLGPPPREFIAGGDQDIRELYFDKNGKLALLITG
jgi:hypothetical protein